MFIEGQPKGKALKILLDLKTITKNKYLHKNTLNSTIFKVK